MTTRLQLRPRASEAAKSRSELAALLIEQTRQMIEMAEAAGKPEVVELLREALADAETIAVTLAAGPAHLRRLIRHEIGRLPKRRAGEGEHRGVPHANVDARPM